MSGFNGKVRCVEAKNVCEDFVRKGDILEFKNGLARRNDGSFTAHYESFKDFVQKNPDCKFELVEKPKFLLECTGTSDVGFTPKVIYEVANGRIFLNNNTPIDFDDSNPQTAINYLNKLGYDFKLVTEPQFTKADLKTGMRVKFKDGSVCVVLKDFETELYGHQEILFSNYNMFCVGSKYDFNLKQIENVADVRELDIVEIFDKPADSCLLDLSKHGKRIWKRQEPRKMTIQEAEKYISEQLNETVLIEG